MANQRPGYSRWTGRVATIVAALALQACDSPTGVRPPAIQASSAHVFSATSESIRTNIGYVLTNLTGSAMYIVNCHGWFGWRLEHEVAGEWTTAWEPPQSPCLSAPIVIPPGKSHSGVLIIDVGTIPWSSAPPAFDVSGRFRVVFTGVLSSIDATQYPGGPEIPDVYRTSNTFSLHLP